MKRHLGGLGSIPNYPHNPLNELGKYPGSYPSIGGGGAASGGGSGQGSGWFAPSRAGFSPSNITYPRDHGFICPAHFRVPKGLDYVIRVGGKVYENCGAPCNGMFFNESEVRFSRLWIAIWSAICMASCLFTVIKRSSASPYDGRSNQRFIQLGADVSAGRAPLPLPGTARRLPLGVLLHGLSGLRNRLHNGRLGLVQLPLRSAS